MLARKRVRRSAAPPEGSSVCESTSETKRTHDSGIRPADNTTALRAPGGGCLRVQGGGYPGGAGGLVVVACNASDAAQAFQYSADTLQLKQPSSGHCVDVHSGGPIVWMYGCSSGPNDQLRFNGTDGSLRVAQGAADVCFGLEAADPAGATVESSLQAWAKPLPGTRGVALLQRPRRSARMILEIHGGNESPRARGRLGRRRARSRG